MTEAYREYSDPVGQALAEMSETLKRLLKGDAAAEEVNATNDRCFNAMDEAKEKYYQSRKAGRAK